jgi:hypothetical protein
MPTVTYFHSRELQDRRPQNENGSTIAPPLNWGFPAAALQEPVDLPSTRIRVLEGGQQLQGEVVALGRESLTFRLLPESPSFRLYGAEAVLHAPYNAVILGEPTRVKLSGAWIDAWCRDTTPDVIHARRALFEPPKGILEEKWIEIREFWPAQQIAFLCAFHRFNSEHYGMLTHDTRIDRPAKFGDLTVICGVPIEDRFSLAGAVEAARTACEARDEARKEASSAAAVSRVRG